MKIGTYNLKFLFDEGVRLHSGKETVFTKEFVEVRFTYFAEQFEKLDADMLFLQELGDESALEKVLNKVSTKYKYFVSTPDKLGVGNAVIYKGSIECTCASVPTSSSMPVFDEADSDNLGHKMNSRREFVKVETKYQDKPLTLLGVHLKAKFPLFKNQSGIPDPDEEMTQINISDAHIRSEMFRLSQAKKMREIIDEAFAASKHAQVVALGDFNATKQSVLYKVVEGDSVSAHDQLIEAFDSEGIDHVLVSKPLLKHVTSSEIYNENIFPNKPGSVGSDHAPITIELA